LRVIAGSAKKRLLTVPRGWTGRPTADRVKEALFNILGDFVMDSVFLDIFAGTGNVGIEALSRGAARCVFIEQEPIAVQAINKNIALTGFLDRCQILKSKALDGINRLSAVREQFNIIFLDPPYGCGHEVIVINKVAEGALLSTGGVLISESGKREEIPSKIGDLAMFRQERYGDTMLSFFKQLRH
jgi:16S rRNA (guanine(966)-N(2))-methyltransferase RsmD